MPDRREDDYFGDESWVQAKKALDFARESVLSAVDVSIQIDDVRESSVILEPTRIIIDGEEELYDTDPNIEFLNDGLYDETGLFWVDMCGLQSAVALTFDNVIRAAYLMGRLDQAEHQTGSNRERFIKARDLGRVVAEQECLVGVPPTDDFEEKTTRIFMKAISKFGSIREALER